MLSDSRTEQLNLVQMWNGSTTLREVSVPYVRDACYFVRQYPEFGVWEELFFGEAIGKGWCGPNSFSMVTETPNEADFLMLASEFFEKADIEAHWFGNDD